MLSSSIDVDGLSLGSPYLHVALGNHIIENGLSVFAQVKKRRRQSSPRSRRTKKSLEMCKMSIEGFSISPLFI